MGSRAPLIASLTLVAVMAAASVAVWPLIPSDSIAIHFNIVGEPDGFTSRWIALSFLPILAFLVTAFFYLVPGFGARRSNRLLPRNPAWIAAWLGTIMVLALSHILIVLYARGIQIGVAGNMAFIIALLFIVTGNFLGKTTPNDFIGVRTPWTRASDYSWEKTNRLGGWMLVGVGFATLAVLVLADARVGMYVLLCGAIGGTFLLFPISRYYWKHDPERRS